jgi:hypothetical protein
MMTWKGAILELDDWIKFQEANNPNFKISDIHGRVGDMIFGTSLEELKSSSDPADLELYEERIADGEVEWIR